MIRVIGMGPGNIKYLPTYAFEIIKNSKCLAAFGRFSRDIEKLGLEVKCIENVGEILNIAKEARNLDILASGDPLFFGIVDYLKRNGVIIDEIIPGISSFQYMMAKLQKNWQNFKLMSFHGREENLEKILKKGTFIILMDEKNTPKDISSKLYALGVRGKIYAGFNLSYDDEKIIIRSIGDEIEDVSKLSVVVVENEVD